MKVVHWLPWLLSAAIASLSTLAWATPPVQVACGAEARRDLHVTAYRNGWPTFAFVREIREVELPSGSISLSLADVPDTVQRETVGMRVLEGAPIEILEQTYGFDLLAPQSLMRSAQGDSIVLDHPNAHSGDLLPVPARVVASNDQGSVLQTKEGYTFGINAERTRFARVPGNLTPRPTLRWLANSASAGKRRVELSYLIHGMGWSADYVATVSRDANRIEMSSWITLTNNTSVRLPNTHLALVAGQVNRVTVDTLQTETTVAFEGKLRLAEKKPERESLSELHLYKVPNPTDLEAHSVKNIQLFSLSAIPIRRRWTSTLWVPSRSHPGHPERGTQFGIGVYQRSEVQRCIPLPGGVVRVMAPDSKGTAHLVSTGSIADTPEGEKVSLHAGQASDVRIAMKQTNYQSTWFGAKKATYTLELRNRSNKGGAARVDLNAGGEVQLEITGAGVSRPSAATWRIETPLAAGEIKKIQVIARRDPPRP